ncbi:hypothetical protein AB0M23_28410 [Streptomyces sp. NPDC052077]|uniref:hypothetical protein n=1 Tax=Streptomyces sp. NPDC052077 TaxID=3154757 RepID=UPI00342C381F
MKDSTLPRHARTGLVAAGWRKARPGEDGLQPIWPILGGAPDDDDDAGDDAGDGGGDQDDESEDGDDDPEGADQLGDAGKRALDSMKAKHRSERERRKAAEAELAQFKATQGKKPDGEGGDGPDLDRIRADARAEARAEGLRERALDRLEARAARQFANPELARKLLADQVEDFVDGDRIDTDAITEALEDLLDKEPYLGSEQAAQAAKRFKDGGDGGPRGRAPKGQLTQRDLDGMTPRQIVAAKREGRLDTLLGKTK